MMQYIKLMVALISQHRDDNYDYHKGSVPGSYVVGVLLRMLVTRGRPVSNAMHRYHSISDTSTTAKRVT